MRVLKALFRFFVSRGLWTFVGLALLAAGIWFYGPLISVGGCSRIRPSALESPARDGIQAVRSCGNLVAAQRDAYTARIKKHQSIETNKVNVAPCAAQGK